MSKVTKEIRDDTLFITARQDLGEFDNKLIDAEGDALLHQLDDPQLYNVVIDLTGSDYYGSSALNLFLKIEKKLSAKGGRLLLVGLSPHEIEILRVTGLEGRWTICTSRNEAFESLKNVVPQT
jgi:anti-anti-sigma factor